MAPGQADAAFTTTRCEIRRWRGQLHVIGQPLAAPGDAVVVAVTGTVEQDEPELRRVLSLASGQNVFDVERPEVRRVFVGIFEDDSQIRARGTMLRIVTVVSLVEIELTTVSVRRGHGEVEIESPLLVPLAIIQVYPVFEIVIGRKIFSIVPTHLHTGAFPFHNFLGPASDGNEERNQSERRCGDERKPHGAGR